MQDENVKVTAARVEHPLVTDAFAYRFDAPDRSIVISGDTHRSDNLVKLARGADVLVHEAMWCRVSIGWWPSAQCDDPEEAHHRQSHTGRGGRPGGGGRRREDARAVAPRTG